MPENYKTVKTYGELIFDEQNNEFVITRADPHVCIKLKHLFQKLPVYAVAPFRFPNTAEICADLKWFLYRYPLLVSVATTNRLNEGKLLFEQNINELEAIHMPDYKPAQVMLKDGETARDYQLRGRDTYLKVKRLLLGDDTGLGKSLTAILTLLEPGTLPAVIVVQTHLPKQWKVMQVERFTNLKVHIINGTRPYNLPTADVYILKYSCLSGWADIFEQKFFKSALFDECQELRIETSQKYHAAQTLSNSVEYCIGLSATPIYNFGDEIFNVLDLINPGCLGNRADFLMVWATPYGRHWKIKDPQGLGSYLREKFLFLRRTRSEVGRELPAVNKIIHTVGYDEKEVKKSEDLARSLAMRVMNGTFMQRGEAARELDMLARYTTGISKAREVADYVRILLENDEPVILAGWHRDVYDIWLKELAEFNPVMYTGSETGAQKEKTKEAFIKGETKLLIISLRSGAGIDGLQHICKIIVFGELDWSPKVHDQLTDRINRDRDGKQEQVTAIFLVSDQGSDPVVIELLGLKSSQAHGIVDPLTMPAEQYSDESRIKLLAKQYLDKKAKELTLF
jgi:SNF2 family DNA or RNA helicase